MKRQVRTPRGENRPKFMPGDPHTWICLRYPPALHGYPGQNELSAYCDRLNQSHSFLVGDQLHPALREMFSTTMVSRVHSGNAVYHAVNIWQHVAFGFYPPAASWLGWLLPVLRDFFHSQSPQPSSIDTALSLANPADLFRRYDDYRQQQQLMCGLRFGLMSGLSAKQAADAALQVCGPVKGIETPERARQRYYKDGWTDYFDEILRHFCGQPANLSALSGDKPEMEIVARYPTEDEFYNAWKSPEDLRALCCKQPYRLLSDLPGYEVTLPALHRFVHDKDPLGALDILLWFDHNNMYPPAIVLTRIVNACCEFLQASGSKRFYECLGFRRGVNPWENSKADAVKSFLALQNLAAQHCGYTATDAAAAQAFFAEHVDEYHPIRDPEKLRQNAYSYREHLKKTGLLNSVLAHAEEYVKPLK